MVVECFAAEVLVPFRSQFIAISAIAVDFLGCIGLHRLVIELDVIGVVAARVIHVIVFFGAKNQRLRGGHVRAVRAQPMKLRFGSLAVLYRTRHRTGLPLILT
jgi:hypothetical protein